MVAANHAFFQTTPPNIIDAGAVLAVFDPSLDEALRFNDLLQREVDEVGERVVIPVIASVWPDLSQSGFEQKLRTCVGAYTHLALSCIACSRRRPWPFLALARATRVMRLSVRTLRTIAGVTLPPVFRVILRERAERAALAAALVIVFDEALDGNEVPLADRARVVTAVLEGKTPARSPRQAAVAAVMDELRRRIRDADDKMAFETVLDHYRSWARAEQDNLVGESDPSGFCHRRPAMVASMAGLAWAVSPYAGDDELRWMVDIAECAQMVDDILDIDKDRAEGRVTPAHTGMWTVDTIRAGFARVESDLVQSLAARGDVDGAYVDMCRAVCRAQCYRATRILIDNP